MDKDWTSFSPERERCEEICDQSIKEWEGYSEDNANLQQVISVINNIKYKIRAGE